MTTTRKKEIDRIKKDITDINNRLGKIASLTRNDAAKKTRSTVEDVVSELELLKDSVVDEITDAGVKLDEYAKENHWQIGVAAAVVGLISGYILGKSKD